MTVLGENIFIQYLVEKYGVLYLIQGIPSERSRLDRQTSTYGALTKTFNNNNITII